MKVLVLIKSRQKPRAARFMSDPVQRLRKGKIAKAVTETISADVAQELRRFYGR